MRKEDFPISEDALKGLVSACAEHRCRDAVSSRYIYVNLSMVRLQIAWVLPKLLYAAGLSEKSGCGVYVITWRENALFRELVEAFGFKLLCLESLDRQSPGSGFRAFLKTAGFLASDGSGEGMQDIRLFDVPAGRYLYEDIIRTSGLSTIRSARNKTCAKKMLHILWMCYALSGHLKKYPPACCIADDLAYHEAIQLGIFNRHGAKIVNVSQVAEERVLFNEDGSTVRRSGWMHERVIERMKASGEDVSEKAEKMLEDRFSGKNGRKLDKGAFCGEKVAGREELTKRLGLDPGKKNAVIMAHTFTDAVYNYGRLYFRDYYDWLEQTLIEAGKNGEVNWILKPHPTRKAYHESADSIEAMFERHKKDNTYLLPEDVSAESIRDLADVLITIGGNAGAEFSCFGIPVIIVGKPYYHGFGYTIEPESREAYDRVLKDIASVERLTPGQTSKAREVFYLNNLKGLNTLAFRDEFAELVKGMYNGMLDDMAVQYFEKNTGTKKYNDEICRRVSDYIKEHGIEGTEYYRRGESRGVSA